MTIIRGYNFALNYAQEILRSHLSFSFDPFAHMDDSNEALHKSSHLNEFLLKLAKTTLASKIGNFSEKDTFNSQQHDHQNEEFASSYASAFDSFDSFFDDKEKLVQNEADNAQDKKPSLVLDSATPVMTLHESNSSSASLPKNKENFFASIAVKAILQANGIQQNVKLLYETGTSILQTHVVPGNCLVLPKKSLFNLEQARVFPPEKIQHLFDSSTLLYLSNCKIAVLNFAFERQRAHGHDFQVVIENSLSLDKLIREEEKFLKQLIATIKKLGIQAIFVQEQLSGEAIPSTAQVLLNKAKVFYTRPLKKETIDEICNFTGAQLITGPEQLSQLSSSSTALIYLESIQVLQIGKSNHVFLFHKNNNNNNSSKIVNKNVSIQELQKQKNEKVEEAKIQGLKETRRACIIVRGPSPIALEELGRALHDALCVLECVCKDAVRFKEFLQS